MGALGMPKVRGRRVSKNNRENAFNLTSAVLPSTLPFEEEVGHETLPVTLDTARLNA